MEPSAVKRSADRMEDAITEESQNLISDEENQDTKAQVSETAATGSSRLFSPYRSLGILCTGAPFCLLPHQSSASATLVIPIRERFHMVGCDKLQPVLCSHAVPGSIGQSISHVVSDASLSVTVVAHGLKNRSSNITLYGRIKPITSNKVCRNKSWSVVDLVNLGKMKVSGKGQKEDTKENALIVAAILRRQKVNDEKAISTVPIIGDDNEDEDEQESDESDSDDDFSIDEDAGGQVVILVATRDSLYVQNRMAIDIRPTVAIHPATYLNKIIVGGDEGLILVNVRTASIVHEFKSVEVNVTTLEQSPALDTVGVGYRSGKVQLINLKQDKTLFGFSHPSPVVSISFRSDASAMQYEIAPMAVGREDGTISIWDLSPPEEEGTGRTLLCEMTKVHVGGVACMTFMPQEPVLVSTGLTSNSVLMHIFDSADHSPRLLKSRKGHTSPPTCIRYLHPATNGLSAQSLDATDAAACQILSGGSADRTLRILSSARSVLDKEFSQGQGLEKKAQELGLDSKAELLLPPIIQIASSDAHTRDWGDLVTIHKNHAFCYVWSSKRGAQSGPVLRQKHWNVSAMKTKPPRSAHARSVAISSCGNYAVVGTQGGKIYKYNIQSGIARGSFPPHEDADSKSRRKKSPGDIGRTMKALEKKYKVSNRKSDKDKAERDAVEAHHIKRKRQAKLSHASHQNFAVTGLAVDSLNRTVISVGTDSKLILWNFVTHAPHKKSPYMLPSPATKMCHLRDSDLASISLQDFSVVLFDCSTLQIVRRFGDGQHNHAGPISDLAFSPDGRTLYTSSLDKTVRVWDVPTNKCVDWMAFQTAPTALTVSPTGEYLATTHAGKLGVYLWSDRSFYQTTFVNSAPLLKPAPMDEPLPITFATEHHEDSELGIAPPFSIEDESLTQKNNDNDVPPQPKEQGLITLSGLPPAHWKNLFHLALIKERNKPKEPPKKPPSAPFFLQWRSGEDIAPKEEDVDAKEEGEWAAAWSDNDDEGSSSKPLAGLEKKREGAANNDGAEPPKKRKITHHRSHLAALLNDGHKLGTYQAVTDHMATLGPSAIDVSLSTLCNGNHDLEEGLLLLQKAALWLLEACKSRERFEAIHAYQHQFLHIHGAVIAGIEESYKAADGDEPMGFAKERAELIVTIQGLRNSQGSDGLTDKMQHSICLLRHFLRMV